MRIDSLEFLVAHDVVRLLVFLGTAHDRGGRVDGRAEEPLARGARQIPLVSTDEIDDLARDPAAAAEGVELSGIARDDLDQAARARTRTRIPREELPGRVPGQSAGVRMPCLWQGEGVARRFVVQLGLGWRA
jgi:hypothetical protein